MKKYTGFQIFHNLLIASYERVDCSFMKKCTGFQIFHKIYVIKKLFQGTCNDKNSSDEFIEKNRTSEGLCKSCDLLNAVCVFFSIIDKFESSSHYISCKLF